MGEMNGKPTAEQRRFHEWCREQGCAISTGKCDAIHHIKGSRMKLKGCKNPGEWYVLPISFWWHQDGENPAAIHINKKQFELTTGRTEKEFWERLISYYEFEYSKKPMSEEEYQIIMERA